MRTLFLISVTALTLTGQPAPQQPSGPRPAAVPPTASEPKPEDLCAIQGKVVNANTGEIIPKALLMMHRAETGRLTPPPPPFTTSTGADGRFAMTDIEPGSYRLTVMRNGYVETEYGSRGPMRSGATLKLEPGQKLTAVDFKMTPHGVISGRILDEDGEPLSRVQIVPMRERFTQGRKQLTQTGAEATNDLGEFRIFGLAPGRYFLSAVYTGGNLYESAQDRSAAGLSDSSYLPTFFPGSIDPSGASPLEVGPGQIITGIEMRLSKYKTMRIRGRVNNQTGVRSQRAMVMIGPKDGEMYSYSNRSVAQGPQGQFEFRGLAPGSYLLTAMIVDGPTRYIGRQQVDVGSDHIDNAILTVAPGLEVPGHLSVEEPGSATFDRSLVRLFLTQTSSAAMMLGSPSSDRLKEDGSFRIVNVSADRYQVRATGLPDGYYVKSVRIGNQLAEDDYVDLTSGAVPTIHINVAEGAPQVNGTVTNDKQEPSSGATVVLIPEKESRRSRLEFVKVANTDQHGRFTVKNLDPGDYRIYAWEDIEHGSWMDPDVINPVESKGKKLTLKERANESVELRVIRSE